MAAGTSSKAVPACSTTVASMARSAMPATRSRSVDDRWRICRTQPTNVEHDDVAAVGHATDVGFSVELRERRGIDQLIGRRTGRTWQRVDADQVVRALTATIHNHVPGAYGRQCGTCAGVHGWRTDHPADSMRRAAPRPLLPVKSQQHRVRLIGRYA